MRGAVLALLLTLAVCAVAEDGHFLYYGAHGHIMRSNKDGSCPQVFEKHAGVIADLAAGTNHLFWFNEETGSIMAQSFVNTAEHSVSSFTVDRDITHLAVDEGRNLIFATDQKGDEILKIEFTESDDVISQVGTTEVLSITRCDDEACNAPTPYTIIQPFGVALDTVQQKVYVTSRSTDSAIARFDYDGSHFEPLTDQNDDAEGIAVLPNSRLVYFADLTDEKVNVYDMDTKTTNKFVSWSADMTDVKYVEAIENYEAGVNVIYWADETADRIRFMYSDLRTDSTGSQWHSFSSITFDDEDGSVCEIGTPAGLAAARHEIPADTNCVCQEHFCEYNTDCPVVGADGVRVPGCCCAGGSLPRGVCLASYESCGTYGGYGGRCMNNPNGDYYSDNGGEGGNGGGEGGYNGGDDHDGVDVIKILALVASAIGCISMAVLFFTILFD
uniref:Uncharacterized protein n=1 Tax=Palpitomonas bilix TaxID=652834 RepID=A0A7S3DEF8_9EUKA|mmetsp:Transcript_34101/g.87964  ORF Transcript_34101/g.87964 Transcript_34101/m.87964 type:complete len:443 (+) Transcript_34101:602-1930(+)